MHLDDLLSRPAVILGGALLPVVWFTLRQRSKRKSPLPPGPPGQPFIGNLLDIPSTKPWEVYRDLSRIYGDIVFFKVPFQRILVVGTYDTAIELLERRSNIYSDRPYPLMLKLLSWDWNFAHKRYGQDWREHRRAFNQHFRQSAVREYVPQQLAETRAFLRRAVQANPTELDLEQNLRYIFAAGILKIVYGMEVTNIYDRYVHIVKEAVESLSISFLPGAFWVEYFPWLQVLPEWCPGGRFKKVVKYYKPYVEQTRNEPFDLVQKAVQNGSASPSVALKLIQAMEQDPDARTRVEEIARGVTGIAYGAAADTTTSAAASFILAMAKYPEFQKKAQAQLDAVLGTSRLPEFADIEAIPYIRALVLETLRWMPVTPLGVAHAAYEDDIFDGYYIPKGTIILANAWAMLHDPEEFPNSESFVPERFLNADGTINNKIRDPTLIAFGFGRRNCPGRYLAQNSLSLFIASTLFAFNIEPAKDDNGVPVVIIPEMRDGFISFPKELPCILTPRSQAINELILNDELSR